MKATAFAPATVANVAVGFDLLGFAVEGLGETATVEKVVNSRNVSISPVKGYESLSLDPRKNTATAGLVELIIDRKLDHGFHVSLKKTIPIGSGLGGSSTSAVAAIVAANALLKKKLKPHEILHYALVGEQVASGARHGDNVAPCISGGLVFVRGAESWRTVAVKTPTRLKCVLLLPDISINTKDARGILKAQVPLATHITQNANLAGFLLGCMKSDFKLIRESMRDTLIEPQRAVRIPSFYEFQSAAFAANALGCSISGSGPTIFAWAENEMDAKKILRAWQRIAKTNAVPTVNTWITSIRKNGAQVLGVKK